MSVSLADPAAPPASLEAAHATVDRLLASDVAGCSDDQLLESLRELERLRRRLAALDHALILEAQARDLAGQFAVRSTAGLLRLLLRLDPREAAGRVRAAEAAGARRAMTGEPLLPTYPAVAAAQESGAISPRHASLIVGTIANLPDAVRVADGGRIEAALVGYARQFDPDSLATLARRMRDCYDPDGDDPDNDDPGNGRHRERTRELRLIQRPDGSAYGSFEATAELAELLLTHFDALAAPKPEVGGVKDPRTAGQRRHDALLEALKLAVRAGVLPRVAGVTATLVVTMSREQYESGAGLARTSHGALVPVGEALRWGGGDLRLLAVVLSRTRGIEAYSSTARLFTENQRLVLHAVDGGCTFPHCSAPPGWCEVHHTVDHAAGGPTDLDHAVLVCRQDHRLRIEQGWIAARIDGRAAWIPPAWIDPDRTPRYNQLHHPWRAGEGENDD